MSKTIYLMRLWRDHSISVVDSGTLTQLQRRLARPDWLTGLALSLYQGRHFITDTPVIRAGKKEGPS